MKSIFADANYWIALVNPKDNLHHIAKSVSSALGQVRMVTSEMVLAEVLNGLSGEGERLRQVAVTLVEKVQSDPNSEVVPQTSLLFKRALALYKQRNDKDWGLTDCGSMEIMREKGITEALTYDVHFKQAGFSPLLRHTG